MGCVVGLICSTFFSDCGSGIVTAGVIGVIGVVVVSCTGADMGSLVVWVTADVEGFDVDAVGLDVVAVVLLLIEPDCSDFIEALNLIHNFLMPLVCFPAGAA